MFSTYFTAFHMLLKNLYTTLSTLFRTYFNGLYKVIHTAYNMTTFLRKLLVKLYNKNLIDFALVGIYNLDSL
ncbi:MAG: hypothetical protein UT84_C0004G0001 [Candidatus Curtissbacteria bacterium GW2011_GWA1_40_16]|uniref:Uncharacterized protein n=1 Tax=Candidatus Curtissbacteria bacterium GW2011_GWA1_40_16 TaxID=1618405 RepID=A0A0G0RER0_9BACT|nr:MAG: hypothetical protein UT84_C0004G0001 [Candidatus Curtissbacteria bacterium GW2011_GWA1_40_16]